MIPRVRSPELPQNYPWLNTEKTIFLCYFGIFCHYLRANYHLASPKVSFQREFLDGIIS
jgi:hypothetical protein